jgi:hypothetical protein
VQIGRYQVIGDAVHFYIDLTWSAHTGTGNIAIAGLPFTSNASFGSSPLSVVFNNLTLTAVGNKVQAGVNANDTTIGVSQIGSASVSGIPMDTAATLRVSGFYIKA